MGTGGVPPATPQEQSDIETLNALMGGSLDPVHALRLLRKHKDLDKAASALLEGDNGDNDSGSFADLPPLQTVDSPTPVGPRTPPPSRPEKPVIDLTKDDGDDELARALQASLEDQPKTFGPSDRPPDPKWAMVSSNSEVNTQDGMSQDEQAMSRAIEASLAYNIGEDTFEEIPLEERVRKDYTPVALRPTSPGIVYAALILHGLFFVPQVRNALANWLPLPEPGIDGSPAAEMAPPITGAAFPVWATMEIFANMDLARMSELNVDAAMNAFITKPWSSPADRPGDISFEFYEGLVYSVENVLRYNNINNPQRKPHRLFSLQYGNHDAEPDDLSTDNLCCVKVNAGKNLETNDLVSSLAADLAPDPVKNPNARRQVLFEPSDVIAFQLARRRRATFRILDQFMKESFELADEKRAAQRTLLQEAKELEAKKKSLLHFNDKDTLADLQSCLYYYENVAESDDDPKRAEDIRVNKEKLTRIVDQITEEAKTIDATTERLKSEAVGMLDCPELQNHRYDLRAVIVHDGLFGRTHLYSYVKYKGKWWKTVDYVVTEVPEDTVLNDPTGLHLGAGPYFLLYSRALSPEEEDARTPWHDSIKDSIKHNNKMFFQQLLPEAAAQVADPNSPPSSPYISATPSEHTIESDTAEPPSSRDEPMDLSD
ncbi:hypothetical protein BC628DRAFT_1409306 [Trametes gibbosa]|nr:hypothetical protein BC628DRAFT_1412289 [Trametes gibbosa]KAI0828224.1 hypothetical protein BC628DRAFT_1409306 [Trametes gibbosa]